MEPRTATEAEIAYWSEREDHEYVSVVIGGPEEGPEVIPCPTLLQQGHGPRLCHVAYQLNEIEVAALAQGGTLWLSTWGGLPVHLIEVVHSDRGSQDRSPSGSSPAPHQSA